MDQLTRLKTRLGRLRSQIFILEAEIEGLEAIPKTWCATFSRIMDKHVRVRAKTQEEAKALAEKKAKIASARWRGSKHPGGGWDLMFLGPIRTKAQKR